MKLIFKLCFIFACITSFSAYAYKPTNKNCEDLYELAFKVMTLRQSGMPVSELITIAKGNRLASAIVIAAYEEPEYRTKDYQLRASREFATSVYVECFKAGTN